MIRSILGGLALGTGMSVLGAGMVSVMMPLPNRPELNDQAPATLPATASAPQSIETPAPATPRPESSAQRTPQPQALSAADQPSSGGAIGDEVTLPLQAPAGGEAPRRATPRGYEGAARPAPGSTAPEDPVLPPPQAAPPPKPATGSAVVADEQSGTPSTPQAAPQTPVAGASDTDAPPVAPATGEAAPRTAALASRAGETPAPAAQPRAETTTPAAPAASLPATGAPAPADAPAAAAQTPVAEPAPSAGSSTRPAAAPAQDPAPSPQTTTAAAPEPTSARPSIGRPARSLISGGSGSNSLPGRSASVAFPDDNGETAGTPTVSEDSPAMDRFAAPYDDPAGRPLMSIVLIDTGASLGSGPVGLAALSTFPYPLSFAIDATLPDAADRAAEYRGKGFEVLAYIDLAAGMTASDTEIAMSAALDAVPGAVGVLEGTGAGLQDSRAMSDQVTEILSAAGMGVIWQPKGLDTAQKLAARDGVPSRTLFRDFDSKNQTPTVIRRFLDQAAFRASQQGAVVMVGRLRPDTISALLLWGLQDRAERVGVAPVTAVFRDGLAPG